MPLALLSGEAAERALKTTPAAVLARITGARKGVIVDGIQDDDTCDRLLGDDRAARARSAPRAAASKGLAAPSGRRSGSSRRRRRRAVGVRGAATRATASCSSAIGTC